MSYSKRRILMVNEGSHLLTGYGTYGKEVLRRLYDTGKYELAEFASFTKIDTVRKNRHFTPWTVYPNSVDDNDPRHPEMRKRPDGVFGSWRFERVLLDFKPDIVFDIRDYWMLAYEQESAFRDFFHWSIMPTVDSAPQHESWLETFSKADSVLTYSDWGQEVLRGEGGGTISLAGVASPGVDLNVFKPLPNKAAHRDRMGLTGDIFLLGTVMRNQKRKLYPDLFEAFAKFIQLCLDKGRDDIAKKSYLYVHTGYPDNGWNIPFLLKEHGLSHKVMFTYVCRNCGHFWPSFFQDARTVCTKCHTTTGVLPNTAVGLSREQLAQIYNLFDAYIQYSICEGFGMPQVEAIACGCPLFTVDYSAMTEIARKSGGVLVPPKLKFLEMETGAYRVYPDNDFASKALFKFFSKPKPMLAKSEFNARKCAEKFYNWDTVAKIWENHFDSIELTGLQGKWDQPVVLHNPPQTLPPQHTQWQNEEFTRWIMAAVLGKPELVHSHYAMEITKTLNYGLRKIEGRAGQPARYQEVTREDIFSSAKTKALTVLHAQQARLGMLEALEQDFIQVAHE